MALRQETPSVLQTADFRGNAYSFPVESVIGPQQGPCELRISVSAGYLLKTPVNPVPQSEQTIRYIVQPDGSQVAAAVVTLLATGPALVQGAVRLHNPLGEIIELPIHTDTSTGAQLPELRISSQILNFSKTAAGEEDFAILKVSQQGADTPVIVSTDNPALFQMAVGVKQLVFTSTLTFVPAPGGTYVHVRYTPGRGGQHSARLFVETDYDTQTVILQGRTSGLLPMLPLRPAADQARTYQSRTDNLPAAPGRWLRPLAGLLLGGLAWAGYVNRCDIAPGLCQDQAVTTPVTPPEKEVIKPSARLREPVVVADDDVDKPDEAATRREEEKAAKKAKDKKKKSAEEKKSTVSSSDRKERTTTVQNGDKKQVKEVIKPAKGPIGESKVSPERTPKSRATPAATDESDLEKELNKKKNN